MPKETRSPEQEAALHKRIAALEAQVKELDRVVFPQSPRPRPLKKYKSRQPA